MSSRDASCEWEMRRSRGRFSAPGHFSFFLTVLQFYLGKIDKIIITSHESTELERVMVRHEECGFGHMLILSLSERAGASQAQGVQTPTDLNDTSDSEGLQCPATACGYDQKDM